MEKRIPDHPWHVAINKFMYPDPEVSKPRTSINSDLWLYETKRMYREIGRLKILFERERTGTLPKIHKQCSRSTEVPIENNFLSCCLGKKASECPYLKAMESAAILPEQIDEVKAHTCCCHIIYESSKRMIDTSEGYIGHQGDRMYWENVIESLK